MVYLADGGLIIRDMTEADVAPIVAEELRQGWHITEEKYLCHLRDRREGRAEALAAELDGQVAGYVNVYFNASCGAHAGEGLPEIVDFGVLEKYRRRGIGSRLMDAAEAVAARRADTAVIGVGLHAGYGSAQRMYVKRGYVPDGTGVWYGRAVCAPYAQTVNDDDLAIYFTKKLR